MKFNIILLPLFVLALSACEREPRPIDPFALHKMYCIENMQFACRKEPPPGSSFFKANINGQDMCISSAEEGHYFKVGLFSHFYTPASDPALNPGTPVTGRSIDFFIGPRLNEDGSTLPEYLPFVSLQFPRDSDTTQHPASYYIDKYMPLQGELPHASDPRFGDGFAMLLQWSCFVPGVKYSHSYSSSAATMWSYTGMGADAKISVERYEREEDHAAIFYRIVLRVEGTFSFGLGTNWPNRLKGHELDRIEVKDGILDVGFTLEK